LFVTVSFLVYENNISSYLIVILDIDNWRSFTATTCVMSILAVNIFQYGFVFLLPVGSLRIHI